MTRRAAGLGGVTLRTDGRWQGSWSADGSRHYVYAWTRDEAEARVAEAVAANAGPVRDRIRAQAAAPRKAVNLRLRFQVLERDGFRCRYCGATPADSAVLAVDHVVPVVAGGSNDPSNLVTACGACNQGKKDRILIAFPVASVS